jgi:cytochrome c oxidase subunit 2
MRRAAPLLAICAALAGCDSIQSATGGDGRDGALFNNLFAIFLAVTLLFSLIVFGFLLASLFRRRTERREVPCERNEARDGAFRPFLFGWAGLVAGGLTILILGSYLTDRRMAAAAAPGRTIEIEIVANQWWWDVKYGHPDPSRIVRTANELHLPVGVRAHVTLKSNDVIHSFWVPNLAGKQDLIPGRVTDIFLSPTRIGIYRAQCAEFCGVQHAHMALDVTVESEAQFTAWRRRALTPPPLPTTPLAKAGYDYVTTRECSTCHNIAGTPASGQVAPDLSHLASRRSIGAGTYTMSRAHLYGWVADPQSAKPGNNMPMVGLDADELHAIVAYLETLK